MTDAAATSTPRSEPLGFRDPESAIRAGRAHACLWSMAILGLVADLWSKSWAFSTLDPAKPHPVIPGALEFQLSLNAGALFGMGAGRSSVFIIASMAALAFVLYLFAGTSRRHWGVHVALGFILAGALGNLYDRAVQRFDCVRFDGGKALLIGELVAEPDAATVAIRPWDAPERVIRHPRAEGVAEVRRVGVVRDFIHFVPKIGGRALWPWVFNVADVLLVAGVGMLLIAYWRHALHRVKPESEPAG